MQPVMSDKTRVWRISALASYLTLAVWVVAWQIWLAPHPQISSLGLAVVWFFPLLFALPGIIKGKPYTHAWANFVLMLYFLHALTMLYLDDGERLLAVVELLITSMSFISNTLYARLRGQELGLKLTKLSQVEKHEKEAFEKSKRGV